MVVIELRSEHNSPAPRLSERGLIEPVQQPDTGRGPARPGQNCRQRCLAAARTTLEQHPVITRDGKVDAVQYRLTAGRVLEHEMTAFEHGCGRFAFYLRSGTT